MAAPNVTAERGRLAYESKFDAFWFTHTIFVFFLLFAALLLSHAFLLRLPYFWDEAGYYIPSARDLLNGSLIPHSTLSNAHPPLVLAWLALAWKLFGEKLIVTRVAMLALAAFSLTGFFRLARRAANPTVAIAATLLTAVYPVFFAQSSLAHVDLAAAGLTFWGLEAYIAKRRGSMIVWFALAGLAKETAVLVPVGLFAWECLYVRKRDFRLMKPALACMISALPLCGWYAYHYARTGFVFGNPEFLQYNLQGNLHPLRILLALLLRIWQTVGYLNLAIATIACLLAMKYPALPQDGESGEAGALRPRISLDVQYAFLVIATVYLLAMSVLGGAVLARYMLPIVPLFILICVSTVWRRIKAWKAVLAIIAAGFIAAIVVNPPYGFAPEDNLAYRDYILLHQRAEAFLSTKYPGAHVLTAWPASDELSRPYLGYVNKPMQVVRIEDFTMDQLISASRAPVRMDVAVVFSTKYQPPHSLFGGWRIWNEWKARYFGFHEDLSPDASALVLGGTVVYRDARRGQWIGVIELQRAEEARVQSLPGDQVTARR